MCLETEVESSHICSVCSFQNFRVNFGFLFFLNCKWRSLFRLSSRGIEKNLIPNNITKLFVVYIVTPLRIVFESDDMAFTWKVVLVTSLNPIAVLYSTPLILSWVKRLAINSGSCFQKSKQSTTLLLG
jgi:hypothetical protein